MFGNPIITTAKRQTSCLFTMLFCSCVFFLLSPGGNLFAQGEPAPFDEIHLRSGGKILGTAQEINEDRRSMVLVYADGATIKLPKSSVTTIREPDTTYVEYLKLKATTPNSVDGHWATAEWVRANLESKFRGAGRSISEERRYHLNQILKLDPNHEQARTRLGFTREKGEWVNGEHIRLSLIHI